MTHDLKTWTDAELVADVLKNGGPWSFLVSPTEQDLFCSLRSILEVDGFAVRTTTARDHALWGRCVVGCKGLASGGGIQGSCDHCRVACEHDPRAKAEPDGGYFMIGGTKEERKAFRQLVQDIPIPQEKTVTASPEPPAPRLVFADLEQMKGCDAFVLAQCKPLALELHDLLLRLGNPKIGVRGVSRFWPWCSVRNFRRHSRDSLHYGWRQLQLHGVSSWSAKAQRQFLRDWPHIVRAVNKYIEKKTKESWAGVEDAWWLKARAGILDSFIKAPKK